MKQSLIAILMITGAAIDASAHSVLINENFNSSFPTAEFPKLLELDELPPLPSFSPIFLDSNGVAQPWWRAKDSNASDDGFGVSHSAYQKGGTSNDWLISKAITIPTKGYTLSFGAQSYIMRDGDRLSDLKVYISEFEPAKGNLPTTAQMEIAQVPEGASKDVIEKDFTYYEMSLDEYVGKTIYISFVNQNTDKDILAIDDILVQRLDDAELQASSETYVLNGEYEVSASVLASTDKALSGLTLTFNPNNGDDPVSFSNISIASGEQKDFTFKANIDADETCNWTVTLSGDDMQNIVENGTITGLSFIPYHRILLEEATGLWCSNCPLGIYAMENIIHDEEMSEFVVPVSVHVAGSGSDYMIDSEYSTLFAVNFAPGLRIDRDLAPKTFNMANDGGEFDKNNTLSLAYRICQEQKKITLMSVDMTAQFNVENGDTTSITADVTIRPAITLPGKRYAIGFSLTENNVGVDNNRYWVQENGFSGLPLTSGLGGFTSLPERIQNWRYMDVARATIGYRGNKDITMPETLEMDQTYTFSVNLPIPKKYQENDRGYLLSPEIVASNLSVVAYVLDKDNSNAAINSVAYPMTEAAAHRMTIKELADRVTGIDNITTETFTGEAEYFTLQGVKVSNPTPGIYVVRRGNVVTKEVIK